MRNLKKRQLLQIMFMDRMPKSLEPKSILRPGPSRKSKQFNLWKSMIIKVLVFLFSSQHLRGIRVYSRLYLQNHRYLLNLGEVRIHQWRSSSPSLSSNSQMRGSKKIRNRILLSRNLSWKTMKEDLSKLINS